MDHKGFTLNELLLYLGVIGFALILSTVLFQENFKRLEDTMKPNESFRQDVTYTYEDMEEDLMAAATKYMMQKYQSNNMPNAEKIEMETLNNAGLFIKIYDPRDLNQKCDGYVQFEKKDRAYSYNPYIKRGKNYETKQ